MIQHAGRLITSKFTNTDFLKTLFANAGILVVNLGTGIITARYLQPEGRGIQVAIVMWPQFFAYTLTFGLGTAIVYKVNSMGYNSHRIVGAGLILSLLYGTFACGVGIFLLPVLLRKYSAGVINFAQIMMIFSPVIFLGTTMVDGMRAMKNFSLFNSVRFVSPILSLFLLAIFIWNARLNEYTASLSMLSPAVLVVLIGGFWSKFVFRLRLKSLFPEMLDLFRYGVRAYGSDVVSTVADQVDKVVVVGILAAADLGLYGVALSLSRILNAIQTAMTLSLLPRIIEQPKKVIRKTLYRSVKMNIILSGTVGIIMVLVARPLISKVFGNSYNDAVEPFIILTIEAIILGCNNIFSQAFVAINKPGLNGTIMAIALCVGIPVLYYAASRQGLIGVSLGILFITSTRFLITFSLFRILSKSDPLTEFKI